jgi:O-antigen ligase
MDSDDTLLVAKSRARVRLGSLLFLAVPLLAGFLAGAKVPWSRAFVFAAMGLAMLAAGKRQRLPAWISGALAAMMLLGLAAFLPRSWFARPDWRITAEENFGVVASSTLSPQPWVTLESWTLLFAGTVWLSSCLGASFTERERRTLLLGLTLGISLMAALALYLKRLPAEAPLLHFYEQLKGTAFESQFGLFPNRNHFGGFCAVGTLLAAIGMRDAASRQRWITLVVLVACALPLSLAVLSSHSRGALLVMGLGIGAWLLSVLIKRFSLKRLGLAATLSLVVVTLVALLGQGVITRLKLSPTSADALMNDGRAHVFKDTLSMLGHQPVFGIGLGNFENVIPHYQTWATAVSRFIHPESDWLWLAAEMGVPALLLALLLLFGFIRCSFASDKSSPARLDKRLRHGTLIAACLFAAHGIVDTPGHLLPPALVGLLLFAISQPNNPSRFCAGWRSALVHYPMCASMFLLAASSWATSKNQPLWPSRSAARQIKDEAGRLIDDGRPSEAIDLLRAPMSWEPLDYQNYFYRASAHLAAGDPPQQALADFSCARYLEPSLGPMCMDEAELWLEKEPEYAINAWTEAIRREPHMLWNYYYTALMSAREKQEMHEGLWRMASTPMMKTLYLAVCATDKDGREVVEDILKDDPQLATLRDYERVQVLRAWSRWGDAAAMFEALRSNPTWQASGGWLLIAEDMINHSDAKGAVELALQNLKPPVTQESAPLGDLASLRRTMLLNPNDFKAALDVYLALRSAGLNVEALGTLEKLATLTADPSTQTRLRYEEATTLVALGKFPEAWLKLRAYGGF